MPFKSDKQRRWMHLHHPEIAGDWEKKYKDGGFVEKAKDASVQGDVVDAKLTPMETILNHKHMKALQEYVGEPIEKVFQKIGLPGFETGTFQARGGGVSKRDYLMGYQDGGVGEEEFVPQHQKEFEERMELLIENNKQGIFPQGGDESSWWNDPAKLRKQKAMHDRLISEQAETSYLPEKTPGVKGFLQRLVPGGEKGYYRYGGTAKKKQLMKYQDSGVAGTMRKVREDAEKAGHTETMWGTPKSKYISMKTGSALVGDRFDIGDIVKTIDTDFLEVKKQRLLDDKRKFTKKAKGGVTKNKKKKKKRGY